MSEPIRILCVMSTLDRGGAESMCMNLYRHIDRDKVQFDFVKHTARKCAFDEEIESLGGRIFIAPRFKGYNLIQYQKWWKKHLGQHPEHQIIHGHYFTVSKYFFSVCKKMGRTTVGHSHTDTYTIKNLAKLIMIHGVERLCDYRLACSEKAGKLLYPHMDYTVLKNAIDIEKYSYNPAIAKEVREEFDLGDSLTLGAVGTIKKVKNPLGMVDILDAIINIWPNTKLLWVGGDGGMKQQVLEILQDNKLSDHVVFTGVRSDVYRLMQGMNAYVMPSISEGIPVSLIEAQSAGMMCFVSDTVSRESDVTGRCQFLPLGYWTQWAEAIMKSDLKHIDTTAQIVQAGYDIDTTVEWLQRFYLELAGNI